MSEVIKNCQKLNLNAIYEKFEESQQNGPLINLIKSDPMRVESLVLNIVMMKLSLSRRLYQKIEKSKYPSILKFIIL